MPNSYQFLVEHSRVAEDSAPPALYKASFMNGTSLVEGVLHGIDFSIDLVLLTAPML